MADRSPRAQWLAVLQKLSEPVLSNLAAGTLKARMPVEEAAGANRRPVTHLEAFGRLIAGIAPWLDLDDGADDERALRARYRDADGDGAGPGAAIRPRPTP